MSQSTEMQPPVSMPFRTFLNPLEFLMDFLIRPFVYFLDLHTDFVWSVFVFA